MTADMFVGLSLNIPRVMLRTAYVGFLGSDAGIGGGVVPGDWFDAMTDDDEQAAQLEFEVNKRRA